MYLYITTCIYNINVLIKCKHSQWESLCIFSLFEVVCNAYVITRTCISWLIHVTIQ